MKKELFLAVVVLFVEAMPTAARAETRLFFQVVGHLTGGYRMTCFGNPTEVGNFFGKNDVDVTLANEFFSGSTGGDHYCTSRMPLDLVGRAHVFGADRSHSLARMQGATGNYCLTMNGGQYCGCLGSANGCTSLAGDSFFQTAADLQTEFNAHRPHLGTIIGSMTDVAVSLTATTGPTNSTMTVASQPNGTIAPGMFVCLAANLHGPCRPHPIAGTYVGQVIAQVSYYCGTPPCSEGGVGTYVLFVPSKPQYTTPTAMAGAYSTLTISSGQGSVGVGAQVSGQHLRSDSELYWCISGGCSNTLGPQPPRGTWVVPFRPSRPVLNETLNVDGGPVTVNWYAVSGSTFDSGHLYLSPSNYAPPLSQFSAFTGSSLDALGLLPNSVGDGGSQYGAAAPYYDFFNSSPPNGFTPRTTIAGFMQSFVADVSGSFDTCTEAETSGPTGDQPPNGNVLLDAWARTTSSYACPASWVSSGRVPSTPPANTPPQ